MLFTKTFVDAQFPTGGLTPPPVPPPLPPPEVELPPQKIYILFVMVQPPVLLPPLVPFPGNPPVELFKISRISLTVVLVEREVFKI